MSSKVYESPDELRYAINIYFTNCQKSDSFPDYAGMKVFLKIKERDVKQMCENEEFADVFEEAMYMRESFLTRKMTNNYKAAAGCMNALKQPINGGYSGSNDGNSKKDGKLTIVLGGVGGEKACK